MDLLSLVLVLRPLPQASPLPIPDWWGRTAHSLLLSVVRQANDPLAAELHANTQAEPANLVRPFTASSLLGRFPGGRLQGEYALRFTAFRSDLAALLLQQAAQGALAPGCQVELDRHPFEIVSVFNGSPPSAPPPHAAWVGQANFQEISAPYLLARQEPPRRLAFRLASPVAFKSGGMHMPLPLPELVFGSLLERWNAWAPVTFPSETRRFARECLAISQCRLQTLPIPMKSGGLRLGCVGSVTFRAINYDRYWNSLLAVLAEFSRYSGLGSGTTIGMGQCRPLPESPARRRPAPAG